MKKAISLILAVLLCTAAFTPVLFSLTGIAGEQATYSFFGEDTALPGDWKQEDALNVGKAYVSGGATEATLSEGLADFSLDFKLKAPAGAVAPISVFMRENGDNAYCLTINKSAGAGISFSGYGETGFSEPTLNIADGKWHSIGIKLRAQRAVLLADGVKVMDIDMTAPAEAGRLRIAVSAADTALSGIKVAGVRAEDMDTVADYDFSTDTYPGALPGVTWKYDTDDGINGIKNTQSWVTWRVAAAAGSDDTKALARVKEFAVEIKAAAFIAGGNSWQRGLQYNLPNGQDIKVNKSNFRYTSGGSVVYQKEGSSYPDKKLHTYDIVFTGEKILVYMDKALTPVFEYKHGKAADSAAYFSVYNYFDSGSFIKINSLKLKTGKGVHELVVEKPAPEFTAGTATPEYTSFGNKAALGGSWTSWNGKNVGAAFRAAAANSVTLSESLQSFGLNFKVCAPAESVSPFTVLLRQAKGGSYEFTVNKTEAGGIYFGGYSENEFSDASLNIADGQWHSVSIRMRANRAVLLVDGVKVMDKTVANTAAGALVLKVGEVGTYFSGIKLYNVKAEDMDTVADYDFSTDTYPAALPGVDWTYDTADGINGIKNGKSWAAWRVASASKNEEVQALAKAKEFALEIKAAVSLTGDNSWQRGLQYNLPNGQILAISHSHYRYYAEKMTQKDFANYPDTKLHTFDIVFTAKKVTVYMDKALAATYEYEHNKQAEEAAYLAVTNYFDSGSYVKINSLKLKTGAGVHELVVEKDPPKMTEDKSFSAYFNSFGKVSLLSGNWKCFNAENVGKAFRTAAGGESVLGKSLKNVAVDFKATVPVEAIDAFSLLLRRNGSRAIELGINKTDGSGISLTGDGMSAFGDSTLNVADGQWHNFSVRLLENRAVLLIDGIKVANRKTGAAAAGDVLLKINSADINFSDIKVYTPTEDDMNELVDYDFSTDSYGSIIPGINWAFDTETGGVNGVATGDVEYTGKLQSASKNEEVQALAKTKDFAMELKFLFDIKDDNSWQRGLSVNLPNGHSFDILGTIFRYDRNSSNKELQREHDSYLGAKEQVLDIVYKGGILNVYINKCRDPVYYLQTEAPAAAEVIGFFTYLPKGNNKIKLTSVKVRTGNGVHDPEFSPYVKTTESILMALVKEGWKNVPGGIAATKASGYNKPYSGWAARIATLEDFVLDFTVQFKDDETGSMALDLRYNLYKDHNEGYPLTFSQRKLVIEKYDDESFQRSGVETVKADFTKPTRVRITAHGDELWIAIDGVRRFKMKNARRVKGQIRLSHTAAMQENGVTVTDLALYHYSDKIANNGVREPDGNKVKVIADYSVKSQAEAKALFYGRLDYAKFAGRDSVCFSKEGKNRENVIHPNDVKDFVMTFYMNMDECNDVNAISFNLRKSYDKTRNYGIQVHFTKKSVQLDEYAAGSFSSTKKLAQTQVELSGWVPIKIVANGGTVAIFVNDELVILKQTSQTDGGFISCGNNCTGAANIYLSDILLTEYYEGAIPANAVPKAPPARVNKDKTSEHKVNLSTDGNINTDNKKNGKGDKSGSALTVILICAAAAVLTGAGVTVPIVLKKRRKNN